MVGEGDTLGLRIDAATNEVIVDHAAMDHLYTTQRGNPVQSKVDAIDVLSVFRRKKASGGMRRDRTLRHIGDNCPLIYALKQQEGLWVSRGSIKVLNQHMPQIISDVCTALAGNVTCIVTIPSRYPLADILAKRISVNLNIEIRGGIFRKSTFFEASRRADALLGSRVNIIQAGLSRSDEQDLRNAMKAGMRQAAAPYSAKDVRTNLRGYFDPLKLVVGGVLPNAEDGVLLVDDLLATGETLSAAASLLRTQGISQVNHSVTWFSKV